MAGVLTRLPTRTGPVPWYVRPATGGGLDPVVPPPSEAGPLLPGTTGAAAPQHGHPNRVRQSLRIAGDLGREVFAGAELGDTFSFASLLDPRLVVMTQHPDHVRSLFTADPEVAPSLAGESPVRPVVGLSVLTAVGQQHRRRRKLMMPSFHGEAIARYREEIRDATARHLDRWTTGRAFPLAATTQAITLDVIMSGVFGIDHRADPAEARLRHVVRRTLELSTSPVARFGELLNLDREESVGPQKWVVARLDLAMYDVIARRRATHEPGARHDILSLLLDVRDEDGAPLTDRELRNELLTLVLAGHETTANTIAWTFERLLRTPAAHDRLRDVVRSGEDPDGYVEATITESMRARPVVPLIGRRVRVPWQLGDVVAPADSRVLIGILLLHHRADLYPDPFRFAPERFLGRRPGAHEWVPFGGGTRRCLGAALAMEELRIVVPEIARRADLVVDDPAPERPVSRNVTLIPARGGRVRATSLRA
ncbi:cytochrome P450 [Nocardioides aromaticivorans]|uniref:Cytochrome P450 n=1 Tax=Nocardioides aromaticivorans TaxID=200618 RepID=A0A7Z0CNC5_9ACTN|nr:cytochrome P450 [Nocardioides aromaticivorans]NYI44760.1 cytochrome P450 [Nocardioides aromaticivorans]